MSVNATPQTSKHFPTASLIVIFYPVVLVLISLPINIYIFGIDAISVALPTNAVLTALIVAAVLLLANHSWLMTTTELTRARYHMFATPEEWAASEHRRKDVTEEAHQELQRQHNAHRNTTENTVYFAILAFLFALTSPPSLAAQTWIIGFALARLGYTYAYLSGKDGARGIFMTLSLLSLYGMASYLMIALIIG